MPPKPKCTREDIIKAAFDMTREKGIESVAARELGKRLGTSATPIFTHFKNMHEVAVEVRRLAIQEYNKFISEALNYTPVFKQYVIQLIEFAKKEPKLFQVIYMRESNESQRFDDIFYELGDSVDICIEVIQRDYGLTRDDAYKLFRQVWMHTFSICVFEANNIYHFSNDEISELLSMQFQGILMLVKSGNYKMVSTHKKGDGETL